MIIDTHIHLYDPTRPEGVPWPEPDDEVLYRTVLPEHAKAQAVPEGVTGTVIVEASIWVEDNQWILNLAENEPFIVGLVGNLDPLSEDFAQNVDRFAANPLFRGIRPRTHAWEQKGVDNVMASMEKLASHDLELDTGINESIVEVASRLPELRMVINHCANLPADGNPLDPARVDLVQRAAEQPNIYIKISGLMDLRCQIRPAPTDLDFYRPVIDTLYDAFGEDRVIFGSDWPVHDKSERTYADGLNLVKAYFAEKGEQASEKYFWKNARAAYKWIDRT
ncbi:MAG: amidohydrolase family protein [bacterium]|nr:amidohydrolase family protein [bacterium]